MSPSVSPEQVAAILSILRKSKASEKLQLIWDAIPEDHWPALFALLDIGAALPPLANCSANVASWPGSWWLNFSVVANDIRLIQELVNNPIVPAQVKTPAVYGLVELDVATAELARDHCTAIDFFLLPPQQEALDDAVREVALRKNGSWGPLSREESPELFSIVGSGLASERFNRLTGFNPDEDNFTITLSLQSLSPNGIAWHRDLYWPKEWVSQDVFAVFYTLESDSPDKGGAFVYYLSELNKLCALYRRRGDATILWNGRATADRILHAVSAFRTVDTSRKLLIIQCLRIDRK